MNRSRSSFFLRFIIILVSTSSRWGVINSKTHPSDISSLSLFKSSIHPSSIHPGSCLSTWSFNLDPCDSLFSSHFTCGLRCDITLNSLSRITDITLDSANYTGKLYITNLPYLTTLELPDNSLAGPIPSSISNLPSLHTLILSRNSFSHQIPSSISSLTNLTHLSLDSNHLTGPIPNSISSLTSLTHLELQHNRLSHSLPNLSPLIHLTSLDISDNHISFHPTTSLLPSSLISFSARNNTLLSTHHDDFPVINQLHRLPLLQVLDLSYNHLSGTLPTSILFQHTSLQQLSLSHNRISALDIFTLHQPTGLIAVDLSYNKITGSLPYYFAEMNELSALSLEYNRFGGMIPLQYVKRLESDGMGTVSFHRLLLGGNYLLGPIPEQILKMKPGEVNISLVDNCLLFCPHNLFFCQGGVQKPLTVCRKFIRRPVH